MVVYLCAELRFYFIQLAQHSVCVCVYNPINSIELRKNIAFVSLINSMNFYKNSTQ